MTRKILKSKRFAGILLQNYMSKQDSDFDKILQGQILLLYMYVSRKYFLNELANLTGFQ